MILMKVLLNMLRRKGIEEKDLCFDIVHFFFVLAVKKLGGSHRFLEASEEFLWAHGRRFLLVTAHEMQHHVACCNVTPTGSDVVKEGVTNTFKGVGILPAILIVNLGFFCSLTPVRLECVVLQHGVLIR